MNRIELEELLWELSRLADAAEGSRPPDRGFPEELLAAYRNGTLSEAEARRVEIRLGRDLETRRRLEELAAIRATEMSAPARQRFLRSLAVPMPLHPAARSRAWRSPRWLLAAAMVTLTFIGALYLFQREPSMAPARLPGIEASIHGLSEVRGGEGLPAGTRFATAEPDTAVTVGVIVDPPRAGLVVGLYVHRSGLGGATGGATVVRLPVEATWETRGRAVFRAPAKALVGERPGTYRIFAVIGREDTMPPDRILRSGEGPEAAFRGLDVKVEPLQLEIVHRAAPSLSGAGPDRETTGP